MLDFNFPVTPLYRKRYNKVFLKGEGNSVLSLEETLTQHVYPLKEKTCLAIFNLAQELWTSIDNRTTLPFMDKLFVAFNGQTLEQKWSRVEEHSGATELAVLIDQWKINFKFDFTSSLEVLHSSFDKTMVDLGYVKPADHVPDAPIIKPAVLSVEEPEVSGEEICQRARKMLIAQLESQGVVVSSGMANLIGECMTPEVFAEQDDATGKLSVTKKLVANMRRLADTDKYKVSASVTQNLDKIVNVLLAGEITDVPSTPVETSTPVVTATTQPVIFELTEEKMNAIREVAMRQFFSKAQLKKLAPAVKEFFLKGMTPERVDVCYQTGEASLPEAAVILALMVVNAFKKSSDVTLALKKFNVWDNVLAAEKFLVGEETTVVEDVVVEVPTAGVTSMRDAVQSVADQTAMRRNIRPIQSATN